MLSHLCLALVYSKWTCNEWRRAWAVKGFTAVLCYLLSQLLRAKEKICSVLYTILGIPNEVNVCQPLQLPHFIWRGFGSCSIENLCSTKVALSHFCIHIPLQGAPSVPHLSQNTAQDLLMWTGLAALDSDFSPCLREAHLFFCVWACFPFMSWSDAVFLDDWYSSFLPDVWGSFCFCFVDEGIWRSAYRSLIKKKKKILFFWCWNLFLHCPFAFCSSFCKIRWKQQTLGSCQHCRCSGSFLVVVAASTCTCSDWRDLCWYMEKQPMGEVISWKWWNRQVQDTAVEIWHDCSHLLFQIQI